MALQRILHGQRVHDRTQHTHMVGRYPIHPCLGKPPASKQIAAADHHTDLHAHPVEVRDLIGNTVQHPGIDAVTHTAH
jgi:hypothetical protein